MNPGARSTASALGVVLIAALLAGCPRQRGVEEALHSALAEADVAWRDRGTGGFDPVDAALADAELLAPNHPEIGWRRVRVGIAKGLAADDPVAGLRAYARARDAGLSCLAGPRAIPPGSPEEFVRGLTEAQAPCVDWTALAWTRWLAAFGPDAAALDLRRIDTLLAWSAARPPLGSPHDGVATWADGILSAVRPMGQGRDMERAATQLRAVAREHPDDALALLDLLVLVAQPQHDEVIARELLASLDAADLDTPEERAAVARWRDQGPTSP